jgi:hypothetical protein
MWSPKSARTIPVDNGAPDEEVARLAASDDQETRASLEEHKQVPVEPTNNWRLLPN